MTKKCTNFTKEQIIALSDLGFKSRNIASGTSASQSTVSKMIWEHRNKSTTGYDKPRSPVSKITPRCQSSLIRSVKKSRKVNLASLQEDLPEKVCTRTIQRTLHKLGFKSRVAAHKPFVSDLNQRLRVSWCREKVNWSLEMWKKVIWSDESRFTVWSTSKNT
jgi:hypothetical protein